VAAFTQQKLETDNADNDARHNGVKEKCIYPNLKLRIYTTGMRQNRLAKLVGIDDACLSRIINGVRVPGQEIRLQIANVLACNAEWLFEQCTVEATRGTGTEQ
jgi:DNA-binding XRE family transcriptional regulator